MQKRPAVALLITLFFIIAITAAVGVSLSNIQKSGKALHESRFLLQSGAVIEDVLTLMSEADKIGTISDADTLELFLLTAAFIPLELKELLVKIEITSTMGHININTLSRTEAFQEALITYLARFNVQDAYYMNDLLVDCMGGYKDVYKTNIFDELPELYRDRIVSKRHFNKILDFYVRERHDHSVETIPWDALIRFDDNNVTTLDANYVEPALWQLFLPQLQEEQAIALSDNDVVYSSLQDLDITAEERQALSPFSLGFFAPTVHLDVEIMENNSTAHVSFDYDMSTKKGKHFEFGI